MTDRVNDHSTMRKFDRFINGLLDGTYTAEEHDQFQAMLRDDPAMQQEYLGFIDLHLALKSHVGLQSQQLPANVGESLLSPTAKPPRPRYRLWASALGAVAVLGLLAGTLLQQQFIPSAQPMATTKEAPQPGRTPHKSNSVQASSSLPAARLKQMSGAELMKEFVPEVGAAFTTDHEYTLVKGELELTFSCGAEVIIQSPAIFVVKSPTLLDLHIGTCSVYAPPSASGFEVTTPQNRIIDLGTRFSVAVNDFGGSEIQVVEGVAEVQFPESPEIVSTLTTGTAARSTQDRKELQEIPFTGTDYRHGLRDRVISYEATQVPAQEGVRDLLSVTVQRGGRPIRYSVNELIGIDVIHFRSDGNSNNAASDGALPENLTDLLTKDHALTTGLINFDQSRKTPPRRSFNLSESSDRGGLAVRFHQPIRNDPGPEIVLFEVQSVAYPLEGDHFRVSPIEDGAGLTSHLVKKFDITLHSADARRVAPFRVFRFQKPLRSLDDMQERPVSRGGGMTLPFYALAVGIDLSDLGYAPGEEANGIMLESASTEPQHIIDPVFIGGLPPLK